MDLNRTLNEKHDLEMFRPKRYIFFDENLKIQVLQSGVFKDYY